MPPRNNGPTTCRTTRPSRRTAPPPSTPAPYPGGSQNQGLSDSETQSSRAVEGSSTTERLSDLRKVALEIVSTVDRLERLSLRLSVGLITHAAPEAMKSAVSL